MLSKLAACIHIMHIMVLLLGFLKCSKSASPKLICVYMYRHRNLFFFTFLKVDREQNQSSDVFYCQETSDACEMCRMLCSANFNQVSD